MAKILKDKPHPRFGATKAQAKHNQELRDLHNKVFQLEQVLRDREGQLQSSPPNGLLYLENRRLQELVSGLESSLELKTQRISELFSENSRLAGCYEGCLETARALATGKVAP